MEKKNRKELLAEYKQLKTYMGAIQIKNNINGKIYVGVFPNLKNKWLNIQAQLETGRYFNLQLQREWNELGAQAFTYEVLEEKEANEITDMRWALKQLEKKWLEKLQPFGDHGYNKPIE